MNVYVSLISAVVAGSLLSYFLTGWVVKKVIQCGIVDHPREDRFHDKVTALMGGISIHYAFVLLLTFYLKIHFYSGLIIIAGAGISNYFIFSKNREKFILTAIVTLILYLVSLFLINPAWEGIKTKIMWFVLGLEVLYFTGAYDDGFTPVSPLLKLALQTLAALCLAFGGETITFVSFPYNYVLTVIWMVAIINAFNLIDNMNGLSAGIAAICSLFFALISLYNGQVFYLGFICFLFFGVLIGFLPYNFPKAKIFMGDCGSLILGYFFAAISVLGSWKTSDFSISVMIPVLILSYPIFDVALVVVNRMRVGKPIYLGGKDHSSHRLVKLGLQPADSVLFLWFVAFYTGFSAFFLTMIEYKQALKMLFFVLAFFLLLGIRLSRVEDLEN